MPSVDQDMDYSRDYSKISFFDFIRMGDPSGPRLDVHWEPSPRDVIDRMLSMADVRSTDVVYDLGCGDGRIVITAAKRMGARAVGVDLDPQRINESNENALCEGVANSVAFIEGDLFKTDISEASVVMLFLFPDVNLRLRPKLMTELRPGTRIVSYCHAMDSWEPDDFTKLRNNLIYFWVVPANAGGRWEGRIEADDRSSALQLDLEQEFQRIRGEMWFQDKLFFIQRGTVKGRAFSFSARRVSDENGSLIRVNGTVEGNDINGTATNPSYRRTFNLTGRRDPDSVTPIAR